MTGEMTLAWEGDQNATAVLTLLDDMTKHQMLVFEVRNNVAATAAGWSHLYYIPVSIFKEFFADTNNKYQMSPYDNYASYTWYQSDTEVNFQFATNTRLRHIWFMD